MFGDLSSIDWSKVKADAEDYEKQLEDLSENVVVDVTFDGEVQYTFPIAGQHYDRYKQADDRLRAIGGNNANNRIQQNYRRPNRSAKETYDHNGRLPEMTSEFVGQLEQAADEALYERGYEKVDGQWYDSFGRECDDKGQRY